MSTLDIAKGMFLNRQRARVVNAFAPLQAGLLHTVSTFGLLAPVTFTKTGGAANLSLASNGHVTAAAALTAGQTQSITGTAIGADGWGGPFTLNLTGQAAVPAAPTVSLAAGSGQVSIAYTPNSDGGAAITSYRLYAGPAANALTLLATIPAATPSPFVETGLTNGVARFYAMSAVNSTGEGPLSTVQSATPVLAGTALPAPVLTRVTGPTVYPPQIDFERPVEWIDGDQAVMQRSQDPTFATGVSEAVVTLFAATTSYNFGLSSVVSGIWYFRMGAWRGSRPGSLNWSNIAVVGDAVAPTITSSNSPSGFQYIAGSLALTANETVTWAITGGANLSTFSLTGNTLSWIADPGTGTRIVQVTATDLAGNQTNQTITLTLAANVPNTFTFNGVTGAAVSQNIDSNTITVAGGQAGTVWPFTFTGSGTLYKRTGGVGAWVAQSASGTASPGDQFYVTITSSPDFLVNRSATLTIAGVASTYSVTTMNNPAAVIWTLSTVAPGYVDHGYASNARTFAGIDFGAGLAIVCAHCNNRDITGVTIGGVAATLVTVVGRVAMYSRVLATAGNYDVVVQGTGTMQYVGIISGTLTQYGSATPAATVIRTVAATGQPNVANGPLTVPANGIGLQFAGCSGASAPLLTWNTGSLSREMTWPSNMRGSLGVMTSTATPAVSGTQFDTTLGFIAASWGP